MRKGNLTGYSITGLPLEKGETPKQITDIEYHVVTLTEKGITKAVNPKTREVKVISKSEAKTAKKHTSIKEAVRVGQTVSKVDVSSEDILFKYGFNKARKEKRRPFL